MFLFFSYTWFGFSSTKDFNYISFLYGGFFYQAFRLLIVYAAIFFGLIKKKKDFFVQKSLTGTGKEKLKKPVYVLLLIWYK